MKIIDISNIKDQKLIDKKLSSAVKTIKEGNLVVIPTETVYGLAADCFNPDAVNKIFLVKNRPYSDPLIVHISDLNQLKDLVVDVPLDAEKIISNFWPGPVSLVLYKKQIVPDIVTAGLNTVCIRMPELEVTRRFIKLCDTPLAAPSANIFSHISSTELEHILKDFKNKKEIEYVIYAGRTKYGIESTVIDCTSKPFKVLRYGAVEVEKIKKICNVEIVEPKIVSKKKSPGLFKKHYSPKKITYLAKNLTKFINSLSKKELKDFTFVCDNKTKDKLYKILGNNFSIIPFGNTFEEIAKNLYLCLHLAEEMNTKYIVVQSVINVGLGKTIMDRLIKASENKWIYS